MKKSGDRPGPEILAIRIKMRSPPLFRAGSALAGQSHLPDIAAAKKSFTVMSLRKGCSQPRNLCSFLVFWGSHDDERGDAAHSRKRGVRSRFVP